jgi:hypothetical protein
VIKTPFYKKVKYYISSKMEIDCGSYIELEIKDSYYRALVLYCIKNIYTIRFFEGSSNKVLINTKTGEGSFEDDGTMFRWRPYVHHSLIFAPKVSNNASVLKIEDESIPVVTHVKGSKKNATTGIPIVIVPAVVAMNSNLDPVQTSTSKKRLLATTSSNSKRGKATVPERDTVFETNLIDKLVEIEYEDNVWYEAKVHKIVGIPYCFEVLYTNPKSVEQLLLFPDFNAASSDSEDKFHWRFKTIVQKAKRAR